MIIFGVRKMFKNRDVISILDFSREELERIFELAREMEAHGKKKINLLEGKILATAFFEPSTRTKLSFETAMLRLGGSVIGFSEVSGTSLAKGENLADTIRMLDAYSDIIVMRHSIEGAAKLASEVASVPVINAGDGSRNHPTQAMLDLYTIWRELGSIDGQSVALLGDLRYGRAATSLIYGLTKFNVKRIYLISPPLLRPRQEIMDFLKKQAVEIKEGENLGEVIGEIDVLYATRIQKERFPDPSEYEKVRGSYRIDLEVLEKAKDGLIIMHPLPKVDEIDLRVDSTKFARYFKQAAYGVPVRMAIISLLLGAGGD